MGVLVLRPAERGPFVGALLPVATLTLGAVRTGASDGRGLAVPLEDGVGEVTVGGFLVAPVEGAVASLDAILPVVVDETGFVAVDAANGLAAGFTEVVPLVLGAREARLEAVLVLPTADLSVIETRFPPTVDDCADGMSLLEF